MDLTLHLTTHCNLRCGYCDLRHRQGSERMSAETGRQAVDLLLEREDEAPTLFFYGGEPLLEEPLVRELTLYGRQRASQLDQRLSLGMTTNGTLLSDDFLHFAREQRIHVALSCDGTREAHDAHRRDARGRGSWEVVDEALHRMLAVLPYAPVRSTLTPEAVPYLPDSFDYLVDAGVRTLIWSVDFTSPWTPESMAALGAAYQEIGRRYTRRMAHEERFYFSPIDGKLSSHIRQGRRVRHQCDVGQRQVSVAPDGTLVPCVEWVSDQLDPSWVIGHVSRGFDEEARASVRCRVKAPRTECLGCSYAHRCLHWCSCLNFRTAGDPARVAPVVCAHEQTLIPVVDKLGAELYAQKNPMFIQKHYNELYPFLSLLEDMGRLG